MSARAIGFVAGLVLFTLLAAAPVFEVFRTSAQEFAAQQSYAIDSSRLAASMQFVLAVLLLMVTWWLTEAVPLPVTALLPAVLLPVLHIVGLHDGHIVEFSLRTVLLNYAHPVIYLFLGGFLLAGAMQKWHLDRRFTLWFLTRGRIANDTRWILLGIMSVTAFLSMWISNTATAAMMLPLGLGILSLMAMEPTKSRFGTALMLGIAWSASIGGIGTIIGTPPNGIALGILESTFRDDPGYVRITFLDWMSIGVPLVIVFLPIAWFVILRMNPPEVRHLPGGRARMMEERLKLGALSAGERRAAAIFLFAVLGWVTNPFWDSLFPKALADQLAWVDEYAIGLIAGVLGFVVPVSLRKREFVLDWGDTKFVGWGTLILFGGGIALSDAMFKTGLASLIAKTFVLQLGNPPTIIMLIAIVFLVDFLTEITSNTAVTSMMVPIFISIALSTGEDPYALAIAAALAASLAFMLPVATPPNALVYSSGYVSIRQMVRTGFMLDIMGWLVAVGILVVFGSWIFGLVRI
jgi:sodium-dependent dicarboxylate transporter 2/3/5